MQFITHQFILHFLLLPSSALQTTFFRSVFLKSTILLLQIRVIGLNMVERSFSFTYGNVQHVQENISQADVPLIMEDDSVLSYEKYPVSVVYPGFEGSSNEISRLYPYQYLCESSNLNFDPGETRRSVLVAIGDHSTPLIEWIRSKKDVWSYTPTRELTGVDCYVRKVGRWICQALHEKHMKGDYLGNFLEKLSVRPDKVTFEFVHKTGSDPIQGIKSDIEQFGYFIDALTTKPFKNAKNKPSTSLQSSEHTAIVKLTRDLCSKANSITKIGELQNLSYFVTHTPLFWESSQKQDFVEAFKRLYDKYKVIFTSTYIQSNMFTKNNYIDPNWRRIVEKIQTPQRMPFKNVYSQRRNQYKDAIGLFRYQRDCYTHFRKYGGSTSAETITSNLRDFFPGAIPKGWNALYEYILQHVPTLVDDLKSQPGNFDYSKNF